ncbi:universal stress protein [Candidatus Nitrosocosmicus franklandus]|uniref:Universal stress protein family protein n=1 Tax=Candidatus Nitrosocosmicus franklandianus TaxID=1798806 RepID=A0A484I7Z6_9ARCH|nr:universal stress protein [Candidatus Nitrosocosmicus franklandus]VFJ13879.1 Universal stress protein family protein [Candidatus Nitrosocosmicus franklandus]
MKILTLVDGSEHSIKALDYAVNLLSQQNSDSRRSGDKVQSNHQLIILNILQPLKLSDEVVQHFKSINPERKSSLKKYLDDINSAMKDTWMKKLSDLKSKYERAGISISTKIVKGTHSSRFVAYSIVKFAEDAKVDMITVGSVGTGGTHEKKSLGSVVRNVAEISTRPVLIVP